MEKNEKEYWKGIITQKTILDVMERRGEITSCAHDLARIFVPHGKIDVYIMKLICGHINCLRRIGKIKLIRQEKCEELDRTHNVYRIRMKYEQPDRTEKRKKRKNRYSNIDAHKLKYGNEIVKFLTENPEGAELRELREKMGKEPYNYAIKTAKVFAKRGLADKTKTNRILSFKPTKKFFDEYGKKDKTEIAIRPVTPEIIKDKVEEPMQTQKLVKNVLTCNLTDADKIRILQKIC